MNKDTKVLLMAVVIILVALVSFNLSDITGRQVSNMPRSASVTVTGVPITFAKYQSQATINVGISISGGQVGNRLYLYRESEVKNVKMSSQYAISLCTGSYCKKDDLKSTYTETISPSLADGRYYYVLTGSVSVNDVVATSDKFTVKHL